MKKIVMGTALLAVGLWAAPAQAATFTPDMIIGSGNPQTGPEELQLLVDLGIDITGLVEVDNGTADVELDDALNYFIDVDPNEPGYFLLKFGGGQANPIDTLVFQNLFELTKLVWTDQQLIDNGIVNNPGTSTLGLSHYKYTDTVETSTNETSTNETSTNETSSVPEPALMSLLGLGLAGAASRLRRRS